MTFHASLSAALSAALLLALAPSVAAVADDEVAGQNFAVTSTIVETPMTLGGYDVEVAAENGFKIVTKPDGSQSSIPITESAKAMVRSEPSLNSAGEAVNLCGKSRVGALKRANDELAVTTGYLVPFPVVRRNWYVDAYGFVTSKRIDFSDGPTSGSWSGEGGATVIGPGYAIVPLTAFVTGSDGRTCYAAAPTATFG